MEHMGIVHSVIHIENICLFWYVQEPHQNSGHVVLFLESTKHCQHWSYFWCFGGSHPIQGIGVCCRFGILCKEIASVSRCCLFNIFLPKREWFIFRNWYVMANSVRILCTIHSHHVKFSLSKLTLLEKGIFNVEQIINLSDTIYGIIEV